MNDRAKGTISVLLLDDSGRYGEPASLALGSETNFIFATSQYGHGEGLQTAKNIHPDIILLAGNLPDLPAIVEEIDDGVPNSAIIVILEEGMEEMARRCTLAGARGYLFKFPRKEELVGSIRELHRRQSRRRTQLASTIMPGTTIDQGKIVVVHGAKGGVGTTTIATNLAVAARSRSNHSVALVDASLQTGDVGVALNLFGPTSIADLVPHLKELDSDMINTTLIEHKTGVKVLLAPAQMDRAESITGDEIHRVLNSLKQLFDYVFVDTSPSLDGITLTALDMADCIVTLATPEVPALKNAARFLQVCQQSGYPQSKVMLVVNRSNSRSAVSVDDIQKSIRYPVTAGIPSEGKHLVEVTNRGEPFVVTNPKSNVSRELFRLSQLIAERSMGQKTAPETARRSFVGKLFMRPTLRSAKVE